MVDEAAAACPRGLRAPSEPHGSVPDHAEGKHCCETAYWRAGHPPHPSGPWLRVALVAPSASLSRARSAQTYDGGFRERCPESASEHQPRPPRRALSWIGSSHVHQACDRHRPRGGLLSGRPPPWCRMEGVPGPMTLPQATRRADGRSMTNKNRAIMMAYDGSAVADTALEWASVEAARENVPLRVVIIDDPSTSPWGVHSSTAADDDAFRAERIMKEAGATSGSTERHSGRVVPTILHLAEQASLLVVGSAGHSRVGEVFLGSVSQHLARHASCPVVVVRPAQAPSARRIVVGVDGLRRVPRRSSSPADEPN